MTTTRDTTKAWTVNRPSCFPRQPNFMTNNIHGWRICKLDGRAAWQELSHGSGMHGETIWGVTVRFDGQDPSAFDKAACDASKMFHSRAAADEYANSLI